MYVCECIHVLYVATQQQLQLPSHHTVQTVNTTSDQSVKCKFLYNKNYDTPSSNLLVKIKSSTYMFANFSGHVDNSVISAWINPGFSL